MKNSPVKPVIQIETGNFTRIHNDILQKLIELSFKGCEIQVCLFIIRKTYGFNKTQDEISISQFEKALKRSRPTIVKAIKNLRLVNIVKLVKKGNSKNSSNVWGFNKYYNEWELVNMGKLVKKKKSTSKEVNKQLVKTGKHTKDILTKESTKENYDFESLWNKYPRQLGKKQAIKHFNTSVKTEKDWQDINKALDNYINNTKETDSKFIKHGSAWFNNWKDYVEYKEKSPLTLSKIKSFKRSDIKHEEFKEPEKVDKEGLKTIRNLVKGVVEKIG